MRVAIAGYGDFTRYMCEEFGNFDLELVVLTRSRKPQLENEGVAQFVTDYTPASLKTALADCDVLISTISDNSQAYVQIHSNLIQACQESSRCKRFIPAEFAANIEAFPDQPGFYFRSHEAIRELLRNQQDLEWTLVCIGWLADYFVPAKNRYIKDIGEFHPVNWEQDKIVIPGTGNEPIDFTWARDVIRALASLVKAPAGSWEPYTFMSGERSCWNDAVKLIQHKYRPNTQVQYLSLHAVAEMIKTAKDEHTLLVIDHHLLVISQACANPLDKVQAHRAKFFSEIQFRTLQAGLAQYDEHPNSIL